MPDTITALCLAIDQGDDTALPILADALEEAGLSRVHVPIWNEDLAWHMAWMPYRPACIDGTRYWWHRGPTFGGHVSLDYLPRQVFDRLGTNRQIGDNGGQMAGRVPTYRAYPTLGTAYLALAEALLEPATAG